MRDSLRESAMARISKALGFITAEGPAPASVESLPDGHAVQLDKYSGKKISIDRVTLLEDVPEKIPSLLVLPQKRLDDALYLLESITHQDGTGILLKKILNEKLQLVSDTLGWQLFLNCLGAAPEEVTEYFDRLNDLDTVGKEFLDGKFIYRVTKTKKVITGVLLGSEAMIGFKAKEFERVFNYAPAIKILMQEGSPLSAYLNDLKNFVGKNVEKKALNPNWEYVGCGSGFQIPININEKGINEEYQIKLVYDDCTAETSESGGLLCIVLQGDSRIEHGVPVKRALIDLASIDYKVDK